MRSFVILFMIFYISVFAENNILNNTNPGLDSSKIEHSFILDSGENKTFVKEINVEENTTEFGNRLIPTEELNASDMKTFQGLIDAQNENFSKSSRTLLQKIQSSIDEVNVSIDDIESSSNSVLTKNIDANSSLNKSIEFTKNFYTSIRSKVANLKTINCYVTRKLTNSYFCPLPGKDNSYFVGGNIKDDTSLAKQQCEETCQIENSCIGKQLGKSPIRVTKKYSNFLLVDKHHIDLTLDESMQLDFMKIHIKTTQNFNDVNDTNKTFYINFDVGIIDINGNYDEILTNRTIKLEEKETFFNIYKSDNSSSKYRIVFYKPFYKDKRENKFDENFVAEVKDITINYADNRVWFCPHLNFVDDASNCKNGIVKQIEINGVAYSSCIDGNSKNQEYGGYFTKQSCENKCIVFHECTPTYRHLKQYNPFELGSSIKDVDVGCVDSPTNTSCTKDLCMQLFKNDEMPIQEIVYKKDDKKVLTVSNGVQIEGKVRPRFNIESTLSANGDQQQRELESLKEMSELSYRNMIESENYNISKVAIGEPTETQVAFQNIKVDGSFAIYGLLRPSSIDYNNGEYYIYNIIDYYSIFHPAYGFSTNESGILVSYDEDETIRFMDEMILLKTVGGFKIIKRILNKKIRKTISEYNTSSGKYESKEVWRELESLQKEKYDTFIDGRFVLYSQDAHAEYFTKIVFDTNNEFFRFKIFNSIKDLSNINGLLFKNQKESGSSFKREYSGTKNESKSSRFFGLNSYLIYSKKQLTYSEILNKIDENNMFYSTFTKTNKEIIKDGAYSLDNINMFIYGTSKNLTVDMYINPKSYEETKRGFIYMLLFDDKKEGN